MRTWRIVVPVALLLSLSITRATQAQPGPERLEVAVNLSLLRVSGFESTDAGIGGRVGFNLTRHIALEGDVDYVPNQRSTSPEYRIGGGLAYRIASDRNRTTGLFGVKIGTYTPRFGVFAKARPGFTHVSETGFGCLGDGCAAVLLDGRLPDYRVEFAFDVGGGFEVYPTGRTVARVEVGDTIIRSRGAVLGGDELRCLQECTSHNVSSRVGFGWRF
jgi:hypothetical protein